MARKRRKTLIVCRPCHDYIHANPVATRHSHWRAQCIERCQLGSEGGCAEKARTHGKRDLTAQPTLLLLRLLAAEPSAAAEAWLDQR